jgi:hypothetical protein
MAIYNTTDIEMVITLNDGREIKLEGFASMDFKVIKPTQRFDYLLVLNSEFIKLVKK